MKRIWHGNVRKFCASIAKYYVKYTAFEMKSLEKKKEKGLNPHLQETLKVISLT